MTRVESLRIENFRGVPQRLDVDFTTKPNERPRTLLLFGDNGSGKSSIADALEYILRASLVRRIEPERRHKKLAKNLAIEGGAYVEARLFGGRTLARGKPSEGRFPEGCTKIDQDALEEFSLAPIVIRRADILGFWSVPEDQRKLVFFDYFRKRTKTNLLQVTAAAQAKAAEKAIPDAQRARLAAFSVLARVAKCDLERIPRSSSGLRRWQQTFLVPRFGQKSERTRWKQLTPEIAQAFNDALRTTDELERAERDRRISLSSANGTEIDKVEIEVDAILQDAEDYLTDAFLGISKASSFITRVTLSAPRGSNTLAIEVALSNGLCAEPSSVLSEANLDLMALLLFCSISEAAANHGQAKVLVFDDVFQSVDAIYRQRICAHIADRFKDWQLVFTTHDRLWFATLGDTLRAAGMPIVEREIVRWDFEFGPVLRGAENDSCASLRRAMNTHDPILTCSAAGVLLEEISDQLSWRLAVNVTRRKGDRYTLNDLWPGVASKLRKTPIRATVDTVGESLILRNLVGAHFNEWARSLSNAEAEAFGNAVIDLFDGVHCDECSGWIGRSAADKNVLACQCGHICLQTA